MEGNIIQVWDKSVRLRSQYDIFSQKIKEIDAEILEKWDKAYDIFDAIYFPIEAELGG
jgi:hypothetical protein